MLPMENLKDCMYRNPEDDGESMGEILHQPHRALSPPMSSTLQGAIQGYGIHVWLEVQDSMHI